jgi:DNA-binding CsgD family transcriptional regulator
MPYKTSHVRDNIMQSVQELISRLYRSTQQIDIGHFREWALCELQSYVSFDAAIWSTGHLSTRTFHTHTTLGLPKSFPDLLIENIEINPITKRLFNKAGEAVDMADVISDKVFYESEIFKRVFEPHKIQRILSSIHICKRTGIYTLLSLYRFDKNHKFNVEEKQRHQTILFHLVEAASHACLLSLKAHNEPNTYHAICDAKGIYHEAEAQFIDLIELCDSHNSVNNYPFDLSQTELIIGNVILHSELLGDLFRLSIRESSAIDKLTLREQQVVEGVTQGLSFKQIAKKLELSPSTVSNHLYRIYQKLNINNRSQLADMIQIK